MIDRFLKLIFKLRRKSIQWTEQWYRRNVELATLSTAEIGSGCRFQVPLRVAGGRGVLQIGAGNSFGYSMAPCVGNGAILLQPRDPNSHIRIGCKNWFSNNVTIVAMSRIEIGDCCQIGDQVAIYDCDFHEVGPSHRNRSAGPTAPVRIGNNVWLGSRVMILKGVTIGDNSVVGAMSLVTRSIPANCIAAGIPARVIRSFAQTEI